MGLQVDVDVFRRVAPVRDEPLAGSTSFFQVTPCVRSTQLLSLLVRKRKACEVPHLRKLTLDIWVCEAHLTVKEVILVSRHDMDYTLSTHASNWLA